MKIGRYVLAAGALFILFAPLVIGQQQSPKKPVPKMIQPDPEEKDHPRVLAGPPETSTMRSGLVTLASKKSVGKHGTGDFEELVIILDGRPEMKITGGEVLRPAGGFAAYCPPHTERDVLNIRTVPFRDIYIVAEAEK